ncbi:MAG: hypothetical protein UT50_C0002G0013 [Candidatus Moranbacteria bacterium GW2011_GWA2_39_41]|nr:MAG: hypothetical protein UT50_C0002G0013 [Candidatus Moranbacteria bacterium GW2011_GWA2_39_41]
MLFSHKRTILFINKEKIQWVAGQVPKGKLLGEVQSLPWSEENFIVALDEIFNKFPKKLRIVIGEEFSYVTHFQKNDKKTSIVSEAQAFIPEKLQDGWDSCEEKTGDIQIMAVQQKIFTMLKKEIYHRSLQVEALEIESVSIARMLHEEKNKCYIFARNSGRIILGIVQDGEILASRIFSKLPDQEYVKKLVDYIARPKDVPIEQVFIQDKTGKLSVMLKSLGFKVLDGELDPMIGICRKLDLTGRDKDVLNIPLNQSNGAGNNNGENNGSMNLREKILLIIFLLSVVGGSAFVYYTKKIKPGVVKIAPSFQNIESDPTGLRWGK